MHNFPIGRLAEASGVNVETIRYYERIGLLPRASRSSGGRRLYGEEAVRSLRFIRRGRELGFGLGEIRSLLAMSGRARCADIYELTARHLEAVRAKIADLRKVERTLARAAADCPRDDSPRCPVIASLSG